jgi:6-phosphogluconate dehydrogenase
MSKQECEIGVVGLGTMGRNLALNFADHGFPVAVFNRTIKKTREFMAQDGGSGIRPAFELKEFVGLLRPPRAVLLMVAAGEAVDAVI